MTDYWLNVIDVKRIQHKRRNSSGYILTTKKVRFCGIETVHFDWIRGFRLFGIAIAFVEATDGCESGRYDRLGVFNGPVDGCVGSDATVQSGVAYR